jgi:enoyl-CoA hydratase/carnithine racemase
MPSSSVAWDIDGSVGVLTFNRPDARNALTWAMYDALVEACDRMDADAALRVLIIRGAGGTFAAGTDIGQFRDFRTGEDGIAYERRLDAVIDRVERVAKPTIAEVDGAAVGGGCAIALACDLRVCSDRARFGMPIARTLGNCLSMANTARLVDLLGPARVRDLILTGRLVEATEALALGLATRVVPADRLTEESKALALELTSRASSTIAATKAMLLRLRDHRRPAAGSGDDLIAACYASANFREGVASFLGGRPPPWTGGA